MLLLPSRRRAPAPWRLRGLHGAGEAPSLVARGVRSGLTRQVELAARSDPELWHPSFWAAVNAELLVKAPLRGKEYGACALSSSGAAAADDENRMSFLAQFDGCAPKRRQASALPTTSPPDRIEAHR